MSGEIETLHDLRMHVLGTPAEASLDYILATNHSQRLKATEKAINTGCSQLVQSKSHKQDKSEDEISIDLCNMLKAAGFDAAHDLFVNGHCDVVVRGKDDFLWLAEAKKHDAYAWLEKGFQQLATRYSTGLPGQDHGAIIVYCYVQDAKAMLAKWRAKFCAEHPGHEVNDADGEDPLQFISIHDHSSSGLPFCIKHKAVPLHWHPEDTGL